MNCDWEGEALGDFGGGDAITGTEERSGGKRDFAVDAGEDIERHEIPDDLEWLGVNGQGEDANCHWIGDRYARGPARVRRE